MNANNPFFILEIATTATPGEIERQGRKLLGLVEIGSESAVKYTCSFGTFRRDATMIREAMSELRDPKKRARLALLASLLGNSEAASSIGEELDAPLDDAFALAGYPGL